MAIPAEDLPLTSETAAALVDQAHDAGLAAEVGTFEGHLVVYVETLVGWTLFGSLEEWRVSPSNPRRTVP